MTIQCQYVRFNNSWATCSTIMLRYICSHCQEYIALLSLLNSRWNISKEHFRPGGIAPSEWTHSVRAVQDTLVADCSAPGANTTRHVTYCRPIVVSPFLRALSVSYCKWTLWRCGQLWPYVGMGSLRTSAKCKSVRKPHAGFHKPKAFCLSYLSLFQSQDSLPHEMAFII